MSTFTPSPQQQAIFDFVAHGTGNGIITAVAGAGKTTTLIEAVKLMDGQVQLAAFNKAIAAEINDKLKARNVDWRKANASTLHSIGYRAWRRVATAITEPNQYKCNDIVETMFPKETGFHTFVLRLVSVAKQAGMGVGSRAEVQDFALWLDLVTHFDIGDELEDGMDLGKGIEMAKQVFARSADTCLAVIDFDDMLFAPLYHNARFWQSEWVLLDEAQDTNFCRREIAKRILRPGGRLLAVGDPHQAIYGFTGADNDAMELIASEFRCAELPLTVTYRCPKAVVRHAQQYVSHIHAHESAPEGTVDLLTDSVFRSRLQNLQPTDAIICRFNAPIVSTAFELLRMGVPCKIEGREIGKGLVALARKWKAVRTLAELDQRLGQYLTDQRAKLATKQGGAPKIAALEDRVKTLRVIMERTEGDTVNDLVHTINSLFGDEIKNVVVLSTIHKAKGREWHTVYQLGNKPAFFAKMDWEKAQEQNLLYVAATRAQSALNIVEAA